MRSRGSERENKLQEVIPQSLHPLQPTRLLTRQVRPLLPSVNARQEPIRTLYLARVIRPRLGVFGVCLRPKLVLFMRKG